MMYKFVNTLGDSGAWVRHFEKQVGATAPWKSGASGAVVILHEAVNHKGVDDPRNLHTVSPIEQTAQQAKAALSKEDQGISKRKRGGKRKAPVTKRKSTIIRNTVNALKGGNKDIFVKDLESKRQKDAINSTT